MNSRPANSTNHEFTTLLRGEAESLHGWLQGGAAKRLAMELGVILVGAGCFGAAMGWWRSPEQAMFVAIKFPLIILLTVLGNALLNAMFAPLLGLNITLRASFKAVLMSFTIASAILGAFSPLIAFMVWNAPEMVPGDSAGFTYNLILLTNVAVIALAGIVGNLRLFQLLIRLAGNRATALRVLLAWLAGNLFLGSQLSWILRPFIGSPTLKVEFLRPTAFHGNFFEAVLNALRHVF